MLGEEFMVGGSKNLLCNVCKEANRVGAHHPTALYSIVEVLCFSSPLKNPSIASYAPTVCPSKCHGHNL